MHRVEMTGLSRKQCFQKPAYERGIKSVIKRYFKVMKG